MKKKSNKMLAGVACLLCIAFTSQAQKAQISKDRFQPLKATPLSFTPYKISDLTKDAKATEQDLVTLPSKKKVPLKEYLKTINQIEKNLADIGIDKKATDALVVASRYKPLKPATAPVTTLKTKSGGGTVMNKTSLANRFKIVNIGLSDKALALDRTKAELNNALAPDASTLPNENFDNGEGFDLPEFTVADYGVKVSGSVIRKGTLDPFSISGNRLHQDSLNKLIRSTTNEFQLGLNVNISTDLPAVGNFNIYKLESLFIAESNSSQKHRSKAKLQVLEQVLLNENRTINEESYSYNQDAIYNTRKKLGAADIFNYGLNILLPVDMYLMSTGVGAEFDIDINRTGVSGTISPIVTQSIILETSASELVGPAADMLNYDLLDIGVGGELRLVQGGLDFGGNAGLTVKNGLLKFVNESYNSATLKFLKGRLYTFYTYPKYICDNIFGALTPSCWIQRRVENDFFNTGSFLEFSQVLADEFNGKNLKWK